ncbi:MAG: ArdC family protein [Actinomycetota bacterium]|nr:ArdC family protein [Actinomycetota bacterium]
MLLNALTGKAYRGGNQLVFGMVAARRGWSAHGSTYKQWTQLDAQVRRGEKAAHGVKWSHASKVQAATDFLFEYEIAQSVAA